ncbi:MAG: hypothetical protein WD871_12800 [Xanthobacteraceae bacterium]
MIGAKYLGVMAGLVPRAPTSPVQGKCPARALKEWSRWPLASLASATTIHAFLCRAVAKTWMRGTSPRMTK